MKEYCCKCGKKFDNPQKFNAHKSHCRIHLGEERYIKQLQHMQDMADIAAKRNQEYSKIKRKKELET